jgi:acyl-CoA dehydrogenase
MTREYRVIRALHGTGVPVAEPIALCEDPSVIGARFAVVSYVDGRTLQSGDDTALLSNDDARRCAYALVDTLADVEVGDDAVLGEVDKGFDYAQVRLGPARITHCMRWLGTARRAADIAVDRANTRRAFGGRLGELGMVQQMIADNEIDIAAGRALIQRACWELDTGSDAAQITSITKTFVAEAVGRVVDRSLQICGALGISGDAPLSRLYREVRPFRIYDGPSETHRWAIAKRVLRAAR